MADVRTTEVRQFKKCPDCGTTMTPSESECPVCSEMKEYKMPMPSMGPEDMD